MTAAIEDMEVVDATFESRRRPDVPREGAEEAVQPWWAISCPRMALSGSLSDRRPR